MPAPVISPGVVLQLSGIDWAAREIMVSVAGPLAEKIGGRLTVEEMVGVHEAGHVAMQFLLGKRLAGASIIPWEGLSLGRASSCKPTPEMSRTPLCTDEQRADDFAQLAGLDLAQVEAAAEELLCAHWPLVRVMADALVERKVVSGRRARQILFAAYRKDLRRWRIVAETDRRNQQAWGAEFRLKLPPRAGKRAVGALCARRGHFHGRRLANGGLPPLRSSSGTGDYMDDFLRALKSFMMRFQYRTAAKCCSRVKKVLFLGSVGLPPKITGCTSKISMPARSVPDERIWLLPGKVLQKAFKRFGNRKSLSEVHPDKRY